MTVSTLKIHPDGPVFSRLVFGAWRLLEWGLPPAGLLDLIEASADLGITTVDHADIYGGFACEARFGEALARRPAVRERLQLVTKCGIKFPAPNRPEYTRHIYDTGRAHIVASAENSLRVLGTDRLDVLLIHRPDPLLDADEVAEAFTALRQAGKVRHFGVSNFTPAQFELLAARLPFPLVTNQIEVSVLRLEPFLDGTLDQAQRLRAAPMAWSPLGGGRLFTRADAQAERVRAALSEVGRELGGAGLDQVALAWLLRSPARIVPVLGTGKRERLQAAAGAEGLQLTREQWFAIWTASAGADIP